jgi:hypothetical protein
MDGLWLHLPLRLVRGCRFGYCLATAEVQDAKMRRSLVLQSLGLARAAATFRVDNDKA